MSIFDDSLMDKIEIIEQARSIQTYETSIIPDQDCCTLFMPAHPKIRPTIDEIRLLEKDLDTELLIQEGLQGARKQVFKFP